MEIKLRLPFTVTIVMYHCFCSDCLLQTLHFNVFEWKRNRQGYLEFLQFRPGCLIIYSCYKYRMSDVSFVQV
jgi:hypothetical protein